MTSSVNTQRMNSAVVTIQTPRNVLLNGILLGPSKPNTVIVWVHGLGSSLFSKRAIAELLVDKTTAVLLFNNRGHDVVARVGHVTRKKGLMAGAAHEVFTDCVDDIEGAVNFARKMGVKRVYIAGHSTGCQKSIYWAAKKRRGVKGIILLAPVSDWAAETYLKGKKKLVRVEKVARSYVAQGQRHRLLPPEVWPDILDAQRFLSLCTPTSVEEIFTYAQPGKNPRILGSIKIPVLVLWAQKDEFADRPAKEIAHWFDTNIRALHSVIVIPKVGHSFKGGEKAVVTHIRRFIAA